MDHTAETVEVLRLMILEADMEVDQDEMKEASKGKDWNKIKTLLYEYEMFKRRNVKHLKFNATAYENFFGRFQL